MKVVLAEKPSVARDLAAYLGAGTRHDGYFEGHGYQVSWALGHLVELKEPQDYDPTLKRWALATLPIVPPRFELKVIDDAAARKQFNVIKRLFRAADELICATDAGREGELIFRYILEMTGCTSKPLRRLWLSSLTEAAIREAFSRLRPASDFERLHAAARCRSESDWIVGLNATRFYTVKFGAGGLLWSVGRVQTPVLAMIVDRDDEIRTFRPEPFWEVVTRYREVEFKFTGDRFKKEEEAGELLKKVVGRLFEIRDVLRKPDRVLPPQLYDLTELQRDMNRRYGMSASETLKTAQALYEAKVITYPRTDSRYLTTDMKKELPGILRKLEQIRPTEIGKLNLERLAFTGRIIQDGKVTDHHAIIPTGKRPGSLTPAQQKVFDAIVLRLIAAFYPACEKEVTTVEGHSNEVPFRAKGVRVVEPGWTVLYPRKTSDGKDDDQSLPAFRPGENGPHEPGVTRGETTPPKPFTENTLLGAMETAGKRVDDEQLKEALKERGLGTPATRAAIIETLLRRGYIVRSQKTLSATDLGRYLIALIHDRALKSPEMTGEWEAKLREIEAGRLDRRRFMEEIVQYATELIRSGGAPLLDASRLGSCPRCGRSVIEGKRGYGCSGWREGCPFVLWKEYRGHPFDIEEVRELVQCRVLHRPVTFDGSGPVILGLTSSGAVTEIPVPSGRSQQTGQVTEQHSEQHTANARDKRARRPRRAPPAPDPGKSPMPRSARPKRSAVGGAGGPTEGIGLCPLCKREVMEREKAFGCNGWKEGCSFVIWKTIAGKKISARTARALLTKGKSAKMKGFKSRAGKKFDARLKLEAGEVRFDFDSEGIGS